MAVLLTKEIYPENMVTEAKNAPQNPPAVAQPVASIKKVAVDRMVGKKLKQQEENISLNDLTALDKEQLRALTIQSVKEIEEAFALIQRVAAEGERRAELDTFWDDDYFSHVCEFHCRVVPKILAYNKRHRKMHPVIYSKEHGVDFYAIWAALGAITVPSAIALMLHFLGLY